MGTDTHIISMHVYFNTNEIALTRVFTLHFFTYVLEPLSGDHTQIGGYTVGVY